MFVPYKEWTVSVTFELILTHFSDETLNDTWIQTR